MDAFIRKYQSFFLSLLLALLGSAAAVYSVVLSPLELMRTDLHLLTQQVSAENDLLVKQKREAEKKKEADDVNLNSLPEFLRHINEIANATKVIVRELTPSREGGIKFNIRIITDYRTFLDFISKLEAHNVVIHNLQVRPYDARKNPPVHAIEFSITPRRNAEPLATERIRLMMAAVAEPNQRNPFQRFAYNKDQVVRQEVDLTWLFRLSGIGKVGNDRIATIDNRDYREGDKLEDMTISKIESDRVNLEKQQERNVDRFILKFRPAAAATR